MPPENSNTESPPQHQGTAFLQALRREPLFPLEREEKQLSHPPFFRLRCRPARSAIPPLAADAACRGREGDPGRPEGGRSAAAGADITRQSREGSRRCPTRHAADGVRPTQETNFAFPHKGEYGGAGGVEGIFPSHPMPRAGQATRRPRRAAATLHRRTPAQYDQGVLPFSKLKRSSPRLLRHVIPPPAPGERLFRSVSAHRNGMDTVPAAGTRSRQTQKGRPKAALEKHCRENRF